MLVAFGIRRAGWSMYQGYLNVILLSWKTAFWWLSLVASGMLYYTLFSWSQWWLNTINIGISLHWWSYQGDSASSTQIWSSHFFGCALRFNSWYVDFISGPSSCENQPWFWLIVKLLSLLQMKIGPVKNLLFVAYNILLGCYVLWPSLQLL